MREQHQTFGQYLALKRKQARLTIRQMAPLIIQENGRPMSNQYLSDIENDQRGPPSHYLIEELARVLGKHTDVTATILYLKAGRLPPGIDVDLITPRQAEVAVEAMRRVLARLDDGG